MGTTVVNSERGDIDKIMSVMKEVVEEVTSKKA